MRAEVALAFGKFGEKIQVGQHGLELVVEVMGDGPGHGAQALRLLDPAVLDLEFGLLGVQLLALGDVHYEPVPLDVATRQKPGG